MPIHEIVMVGTHDAGINQPGHGNVQTQTLQIGQQAAAGVRFFDLRVAAAKVTPVGGGAKSVEMRTYHGGLKGKTKTRNVTIGGVTQARQVETRDVHVFDGERGVVVECPLQTGRNLSGVCGIRHECRLRAASGGHDTRYGCGEYSAA